MGKPAATGSFKVRGALNKVLTLEDWERQQGLVTASAGNHGQGVALAARETGAKVNCVCIRTCSASQIGSHAGAGCRDYPGSPADMQRQKRRFAYAEENQSTWVSPYNDGQVIAGQATLGLELIEQMPLHENYTCLFPVGGGGLIAGIGAAIRLTRTLYSLVGVQSEASPSMYPSIISNRSRSVRDRQPGGWIGRMVEPGSITIPMVQKYVNGFVLVTEEEIAQAIAYSWYHYGEKIEGSAAAALAAALTGKVAERPAVVVITGGNIQPEIHSQICERWRECGLGSAFMRKFPTRCEFLILFIILALTPLSRERMLLARAQCAIRSSRHRTSWLV
jgi:threonine dehydratase